MLRLTRCLLAAALPLLLAGPLMAQETEDSPSDRSETPSAPEEPEAAAPPDFSLMLAGRSAIQGEALEAALAKAAAHPLGSQENPVRAHMPQGQRAYLNRLRCSDISRPEFYREGSVGVGPYGNIVDLYVVTCESAEPSKTRIFMDMYHEGYAEREAVAGFGITGGRRED